MRASDTAGSTPTSQETIVCDMVSAFNALHLPGPSTIDISDQEDHLTSVPELVMHTRTSLHSRYHFAIQLTNLREESKTTSTPPLELIQQ